MARHKKDNVDAYRAESQTGSLPEADIVETPSSQDVINEAVETPLINLETPEPTENAPSVLDRSLQIEIEIAALDKRKADLISERNRIIEEEYAKNKEMASNVSISDREQMAEITKALRESDMINNSTHAINRLKKQVAFLQNADKAGK